LNDLFVTLQKRVPEHCFKQTLNYFLNKKIDLIF